MQQLTHVIASGWPNNLSERDLRQTISDALDELFVSRYYANSRRNQRIALIPGDDRQPSFAGLVHEEAPSSGAYGGMSIVWFPIRDAEGREARSLLTLVCGTRGLSPDEQILSRPGHARYLRALARHLSESVGVPVWVKHDPTQLSESLPQVWKSRWPDFSSALSRYGNYIYAAVEIPHDAEKALPIVKAFFDFYAWERRWSFRTSSLQEFRSLQHSLHNHLFPRIDETIVDTLLRERRFVILQGPPGTGKTRLALRVLRNIFGDSGEVIQFHPAITYETFVCGIVPDVHHEALRFRVREGSLVHAARKARQQSFLLVIDEVNRADLGRVLGEAIYLFEPREMGRNPPRRVQLPHEIPEMELGLAIPEGLFVLGTMNSADRSIAILDLAVRRRFAFIDVWPDSEVVAQQGIGLATDAFEKLLEVFAQYAPEEELVFVPGHAYFLASGEDELVRRLTYELIPLLEEYLREGRMASCETELRGYLEWLKSEISQHADA